MSDSKDMSMSDQLVVMNPPLVKMREDSEENEEN